MKALLALFMACIFPTITAKGETPLIPCSDLSVDYSAPELTKDGIVVTKLSKAPTKVIEEADRAFKPHSPQGTAAFNRVHIANTMKAGPWNNTIQIFTVSGPKHAWQIDAHDIRDNVTLQWINDDLLFIQVWWGRIVSTDSIFQISTGTFIYQQEANYGALTQPCEDR